MWCCITSFGLRGSRSLSLNIFVLLMSCRFRYHVALGTKLRTKIFKSRGFIIIIEYRPLRPKRVFPQPITMKNMIFDWKKRLSVKNVTDRIVHRFDFVLFLKLLWKMTRAQLCDFLCGRPHLWMPFCKRTNVSKKNHKGIKVSSPSCYQIVLQILNGTFWV